MATLFHSFIIFSFLLLFTVDARLTRTSPEDEAQNPKIGLSTEKSLDSGPGSVMNIEVKSKQDPKVPGMYSHEFKMPASGSLAVNKKIKLVDHWPRIDHRYNPKVFRRSFPVNCRHRIHRLHGSEEEKDFSYSRSGKIVSARWIDGTTLHQLDAVTIPDFVDGERMVIREFRNPRFVLLRNPRRRKHHQNGLGHFIWQKLRNFLINL